MPREAELFKETEGNIIKAYFILRKENKNVPKNWVERYKESRQKIEEKLKKLLKSKNLDAVALLENWQMIYQKECFYKGLRILLDLERYGKTEY